jgi:hypothetical protein
VALNFYAPETIEFDNAWQVAYYAECLDQFMGKDFDYEVKRLEPEKDFDDDQRYSISFSRPPLKSIHDRIWSHAIKLQGKEDLGITDTEKLFEVYRVFAVRDATIHRVNLFGFGEYVGDEIPDAAGGYAAILRARGQTNPKIVLDNGQVVWGCECWWGKEKDFQKKYGHLEVVDVPIEHFRMESRGE